MLQHKVPRRLAPFDGVWAVGPQSVSVPWATGEAEEAVVIGPSPDNVTQLRLGSFA